VEGKKHKEKLNKGEVTYLIGGKKGGVFKNDVGETMGEGHIFKVNKKKTPS